MRDDTYLSWLTRETKTTWWHDSADPAELQRGLERGCVGVTTNPLLTSVAVAKNRERWADDVAAVLAQPLQPEAKAEALMRIAVTRAAERLTPRFESSRGRDGFVCAQVNPSRAGDRDGMLELARRFHAWAPNIAVKLPVTAAGLDILEECIAAGITITATVSFTVPQVIAVAERHRRGIERAQRNGVAPGRCFAVIMAGRLDDYLREVAHDNRETVGENDLQLASLAVTKRAYAIFRERRYESVLLVAALRGAYHLTELAGAELVMSIAPPYQELFVTRQFPREERIAHLVSPDVIDRLRAITEFVRAYEPDGMAPHEFVTYGPTQRTLAQFAECGWKQLEGVR